MTIALFMGLLVVLAVVVSLITEAVKKALESNGAKYSSNLVVLIVSVVVGAGGTILTYIFMGIAFTVTNILCIALMALAVWLGAMVGYDKVLQMIEQFKALETLK